jgi:putative tryptophan/tyrosine transport system substrate-binding protein
LAARAEPPAIPIVAFFHPGSPERNRHLVAAFRGGLADVGYEEERNVAIEYCWAEDQHDRLPALAENLVRRHPALIVATSTDAVLATSRATSTIPIIFNFASDPVRLGLVASLNRPGKNITGISSVSLELAPRQLELLHHLVPTASSIGVLVNPANPIVANTVSRDLRTAARSLELQLHVLHASTDHELHEAFESLARLRARGLVIGPDTFLDGRIKELAVLTIQHAVPAIYQFREFASAGGLLTYGTIHTDPYHQAGIYAGKILEGANPRDLPVQQPNKLELVVNLNTAKAMGLTIPPWLLARADEVIE